MVELALNLSSCMQGRASATRGYKTKYFEVSRLKVWVHYEETKRQTSPSLSPKLSWFPGMYSKWHFPGQKGRDGSRVWRATAEVFHPLGSMGLDSLTAFLWAVCSLNFSRWAVCWLPLFSSPHAKVARVGSSLQVCSSVTFLWPLGEGVLPSHASNWDWW